MNSKSFLLLNFWLDTVKLVKLVNILDTLAAIAVEMLSPNVARLGTATQVSSYHHTSLFSDPDDAHYAIDGDFDTDVNAGARCAITWNNPGAWWRVDLIQEYSIEKIAITTRKAGKVLFIPTGHNDIDLNFHAIV